MALPLLERYGGSDSFGGGLRTGWVVGVSAPIVISGGGGAQPRCTRRAALRAGLAAAGVAAVGAVLSACGPTVAGLTNAAAGPVVITWLPWTGFPSGTTPAAAGLMLDGLRPWLEANPSVRVRVAQFSTTQDTLAAMRSGEGPDVFHDAVLPAYTEENLALDLQPYIRSGGVDLSIFSRAALDYFVSAGGPAGAGGGLCCLPAFMNTLGVAVNVGRIDELGLNPPEPGWTYRQWAALWQGTTHAAPGSGHRYGGNFQWTGYDRSGGGNPAPFYLKGFGGEYVDPADATQCYLDRPGSIAALQWCYDLRRAGVLGGDNRGDIATGRQLTGPVGTAGDLAYAAQNWRGLYWDILPMPIWPGGAATFGSSDFYGIWTGTKTPDVAWSLLRFLCVETEWQNFMTKLALVGPNQKALWRQWEATVLQYATPLAAVNLNVFTEAVQGDLPYVGRSFQFADGPSARAINRYCSPAQAGTVSVAAAALQAAAAVNALQAAAAGARQRSATALQQVEQAAAGTPGTRLPPVGGSGRPPTPAGAWIKAGTSPGAVLLLGDGDSIGGMADTCVFAGGATSATTAEYTCRVAQLANLTCPTLSPAATAGLMVRGNLGDGAAMLALAVTAQGGVVLEVRPVATGTSVTLPAAASALGLGSPTAVPAGGFRPTWLKLRRSGTTWTGLISLDGRTWRPAGSPITVAMAGVWAGVYVCANNGGFGDRGYVRGGFDQTAGFTPSAVYQVGQAGIPPEAGVVPAEWTGSAAPSTAVTPAAGTAVRLPPPG